MVNLNALVRRLLETRGLTQNREAADILGISPADLSNRKRRGTLLPLLIEWAINENVNLHWFITGNRPGDGNPIDHDPEIAELLEGAKKVLTSGNPIAFDALERNIRYFSHAIDVERRLQGMEQTLAELARQLTDLKKRRKEDDDTHDVGPLPNEKAA